MMRITSLLLLLSPLLASAFTAPHFHQSSRTVLQVAAEPDTGKEINLILNGNNIELTPALSEYVEKRIGSPLRKLGGGIVREVDVHLSVYKNPKVKNAHRVDLTAILKGLTIHCREESPDMYASIDAVSTALQSKLSKYRKRRNDGYHSGSSMGDDLMAALQGADLEEAVETPADDFVDPEEPRVMKVNSYDLENPIPLKEAIFALDYVDHDFFVFLNEETNKPSVVYKRNAGGVGLVEL